jgi:predicted AlkP superfamily phosphohydrolase/phosphomutase
MQAVPDIGALATRGTPSSSVPLLFVGIDGATWRVLQPAIDNGSAPTFRAIIEHGVSGDVGALWPPFWSGAAWASIVTGLPRETTGVYEDLGAISPGLPPFQVTLLSSFKLNLMYTVRSYLQEVGLVRLVPPPRALLKAKPVWQLLHESRVNSAVIRFRFTYPPDEQADIVVSDWVGHDGWDNLGVKHSTTPDTVWPPTMATQLLFPFQRDTADPGLSVRLFPGPLSGKPADAVLDPFAALRVSADVDERTFQASSIVLEHNPRQPFMAVYIGGLDSAEHAFWQYRFPEDYGSNPPAAEDIKRFSPVIERYVRFIDERLKDLLALYQQEPNIVIVSDHGYGASPIPDLWRGWHTKDGIFLAAGPSVPKVKERIAVSYYDIVPTLVSLKGFDKPTPLRGKPLFELTGQTTARAARSH